MALFVEALELYFKMASETISERLSAGDTPLHGIRNFFDEIIEDIVSNKHTHGCLMINTATELAELEGNQSIRCRLNEMFLSHQKQFEQALFKAQEQGEISSDKDPVGLARYLLVGVRGLRVYGQGHPQREELEGVVKNMLAVLSAQ